MAKQKHSYNCQNCGSQFPQWSGHCPECNSWNSLIETLIAKKPKDQRAGGYSGHAIQAQTLASIEETQEQRFSTGYTELDRVLGDGIVSGSVVLIGGDPGIGKSTLLLQMLAKLANQLPVLYVTGEESPQQVSLRAHRAQLINPQNEKNLKLLAETQIDHILDIAQKENPRVLVIDSIQTVFTELLASTPGSVSQVRECAAQLVRFAKQSGTTVFLVGHVTKEGSLAGPRVLEHMVDTVLYFEGDHARYRVIRATKNRFGAINELGVFAMTDKGLREVTNPSAIFLSRHQQPVPGSTILVTREGRRPFLVEVQALVDESHLANPRRLTLGMDQNRLAMLLAVLHRHGGFTTVSQDVFINIVGGVRISETGADLAVLMAILSSFRNKPLANDLFLFGEVGLAGEIRPVSGGPERIKEAAKHGLKQAIVPQANAPKENILDCQVHPVNRIGQAIELLF